MAGQPLIDRVHKEGWEEATPQHQSLHHLLQNGDPKPIMQFLQNAIAGKHYGHGLHRQNPGATRQLAMIGG